MPINPGDGSTNNSMDCLHPNQYTEIRENTDGNTREVRYCPSCGMEW